MANKQITRSSTSFAIRKMFIETKKICPKIYHTKFTTITRCNKADNTKWTW